MNDLLVLNYGGVEMSSRPRDEPLDGYELLQGGLTGWWGRPASSASSQPRPGAHGEFDEPLFLPARIVTAVGVIRGDRKLVRNRTERLTALGADGSLATLSIDDDGDVAYTQARVLNVQAEVDRLGRPVEFQAIFRCPDPRKYGDDRDSTSTGGQAEARHYGTFAATPRIRITGFSNGYRIIGPGQRAFSVTGPKAASDIDIVDFGTGFVTRNGEPLLGRVTNAHTWTVPAGRSIGWRVEAIGSGSGSALLMLRDTSI